MKTTIRNWIPVEPVPPDGDGDGESQSHNETRPRAQARRPSTRPWVVPPDSNVPTYAGIGLVLAGFGLLAVAWASVAGEASVALQIPYIISAGFTGLGLIMSGLLVINISAKRQDAAQREREFSELADLLRELRTRLDDEQGRT